MSVMPSSFRDLGPAAPGGDGVAATGATGPADPPATRAALPPGTYDVAAIAVADIGALQRDPKTKLLGATIENARINYAAMIARGGRVLVTASEGNGGKPVAVLVPPGFDASEPARVHTHYHGFNATVADPRGHSSGTTVRIEEVQAADPQAVFVLPECGNAPVQPSRLDARGAYATRWSNVSSVTRTTDDALSAAGIPADRVGLRVVSAHSGGGAALAAAIDARPDGSGLRCDRLELLDSLYGSEVQLARWARTDAGRAATRVTYYHGTNTHATAALRSALGSRWQRVDVRAPTPTEDPFLKDARGNNLRDANGVARRRYSADAHNRTNGEFMDDRGRP